MMAVDCYGPVSITIFHALLIPCLLATLRLVIALDSSQRSDIVVTLAQIRVVAR